MTTESAALERLQQRLGYNFGDRGILLQSMTHTSFGHENLTEKIDRPAG